jgi:GxxExxY protein
MNHDVKKLAPDFHAEGLTERIIGAAIEVHRELGPGLLESAYERCLWHELLEAGLPARRQVELPVHYKGHQFDCAYRIDILVAEAVVVEIKSVETTLPIHEAQLMTYLRLGGFPVGLLLNFNLKTMKEGIIRRAMTRM